MIEIGFIYLCIYVYLYILYIYLYINITFIYTVYKNIFLLFVGKRLHAP